MKRKILTFLSVLMAFSLIFAFAACGEPEKPKPEPPKTDGTEFGEYYYDTGSTEYSLVLSEGCVFKLTITGETKTGSYTLEEGNLTLEFESEEGFATATLANDVLTLTYGSANYRFLRKKNFTVKFMANDSSFKELQVLNGKTVERPADPSKDGYVFVGWYTDSSLQDFYNFKQPVSGNLTLYARFTEATSSDVEFTVSFDLGYEGAEEIPAQKTIGGKLYNLPTPEREGDEFVGWWVSVYNDGEKLTYQYKEHTLLENTTLFAVWESEAPCVSIDGNHITWFAPGANNNYTVVITGPNEVELYRKTSGATSYDGFDFAAAEAGDYVVSVTLGKTTTSAYYRNRALAKASGFRVEESTFMFNPVEHAESYELRLVCGTAAHNHRAIDLGDKTSYDFGNCEMPEGGFIFVVTAKAADWSESVSDAFTFNRTLDAVTGLTVNATTDTVSWTAVRNATSYYLTLLSNGQELVSENIGNVLLYDLSSYAAGDYTVKVYPLARGWHTPAETSFDFSKVRLAAPANLRIEGTDVVWDEVPGATGYEVKIGNKTYTFATNSFEFTEKYLVEGQNTYSISVRALGNNDAEHSFFSAVLTASIGSELEDNLRYSAGVLTWDPMFGVRKYVVKVNEDGEEKLVEAANSISVTLTKARNILFVAAVLDDEGTRTEWRTVAVLANILHYDTQLGNTLPDEYYATGDPITLPVPTRTGYDFENWYLTPGGAEDGLPFDARFYTSESDMTLYAAWTPKTYTVQLDVGANGAATLDNATVAYDSEYVLPVPESKSEELAFAGWFTMPNGRGYQYSDYTGKCIRIWGETADRVGDNRLYAYWVEIFTFVESSDGVTVSKGAGIGYVTKITIPATHAGKTVTMLNDFSGLTQLTEVNFYNSVNALTLGSIGIVFNGCTNLEDVNVLEEPSVKDPRFWSVDGVLLGYNINGDVQIYYYPTRHKLVENTYRIPDGVTRLVAGTFYDNKSSVTTPADERTLQYIVVPASVTDVDMHAFYNIRRVREITFLDPENAEEAKPLNIAEGAFEYCDALITLNLPARLSQTFTGAAFTDTDGGGMGRLRTINIQNSPYYETIEGLLTKKIEGNGRELVYYPLPRYNEGATNLHYTKEIIIPFGVTAIPSNAIPTATAGSINAVTKIQIARTVTYIGESAFYSGMSTRPFSSVTELIFEATEEDRDLEIASNAFYGFAGLPETFDLPRNLTKLASYAFGNVRQVKTVNVNCGGAGRVLDFEPNVFAIPSSNTSYIETVNLGPDMPLIDIAAVFGSKVKFANVDPANENFVSADGVIFDKAMTKIVFFSNIKTDFVVPVTVTSIGPNLFKGKTDLEKVSLPASLESIGANAFSDCKALKTVEFRNEGTPAAEFVIGDSAFSNCASLQEFTFPATTTEIGNSAFTSTNKLTKVTLNDGLKKIGEKVFWQSRIREITIPASVEEIVTTITNSGMLDKNGGKGISIEVLQTFQNCYYLEAINVDPANPKYASVNGVLYGKTDGKITDLIYCPRNYEGEGGVLNVPASVNKVWSHAFYLQGNKSNYSGTKFLTEIRFADSETELNLATEAFLEMYEVKAIRLPKGLKVIGEYGFSKARSLEKIVIPNTVTKIGARAFHTCTELKTVEFEAGGSEELVLEGGDKRPSTTNPSSGDAMFQSSTKLTSITLPERMTYIDSFVFSQSKIGSITIPKTVERIGYGAFYSCYELTEINFAADGNLTEIEDCAFREATALTGTIKFPASLKKIGGYVFYHSHKENGLAGVVFNEGLEEIGNDAFRNANFTNITLPASLKKIGSYAFGSAAKNNYALDKLESVTFAPNSRIEEIGGWAFGFATKLSRVDFGTPVANALVFKERVFSHTALTSIELPKNTKEIGPYMFAYDSITPSSSTYVPPTLTSVTFAEGVTKLTMVGNYAFKNCTALKNFAFPASDSTISLGDYMFTGVTDLNLHLSAQVEQLNNFANGCTFASITIDESNPYIKPDTNNAPVIYDSEGSILLVYGEVSSLSIPDGAKTIAASAFKDNKTITSIEIPDTIILIDNYAFQGCTNLKTVTFKNGSKLETIGLGAFKGCTSLTTINLNETSQLIKVSNDAFNGCTKLQEVDLSRNTKLTELGYDCFAATTALTTAKLPRSIEYIGLRAFKGSGITEIDLSALTNLTDLRGTSTITTATSGSGQGNTFEGCKNLVRVKLPDTLERISGYCFKDCAKLQFINLGRVKIFGSYAFSGCKELLGAEASDGSGEAIFAPNVEFGQYAFQNCTALKKVTFDSITRMFKGAFENTGITTLALPAIDGVSVTASSPTSISSTNTLGDGVFRNCKQLTGVTFADGSTYLRQSMFEGCIALTSVEFPESLHFQAPNASSSQSNYTQNIFKGCTSLKTVKFHANTTELAIAKGMFMDCSALESVAFPAGLVKIDQTAFQDCTALKTVTFAGSTANVDFGTYAFQNCGFETFEVPNAKSIGASMIQDCKKLKTVTFAADFSLATLPNTMFQNCSALTSIVLPNGLTTIPTSTFQNCTALANVTLPDGLVTIGQGAFKNCSSLERIIFPDSVTTIGQGAFQDSGLKELNLNKITTLEIDAFRGTKLKTVTITNLIETLKFATSGSTYKGHQFAECELLETVIFQEGTKLANLGNSLFRDCPNLRSVTLAEGVENIGNYTFTDCPELKSLAFPKSLTTLGAAYTVGTDVENYVVPEQITTLGDRAFSGAGFKSVTLPQNLTEIGKYAFEKCTALTSITLPNGVTTIGDNAFDGCTNLAEVVWSTSLETIGSYAFRKVGLKTLVIPDSVTTIKNYAFTAIPTLTSVKLSKNLDVVYNQRNVYSNIFKDCTALTTVDFNGVTQLANNMFQNCTALKQVTLPEDLTYIGQYTFAGSGLERIDLSKMTKLKIISSGPADTWAGNMNTNTFKDCKELVEVILPPNLEQFGTYTFSGCTKLKSIVIPESVSVIGYYAFSKSGLESIDLSKNTQLKWLGAAGATTAPTITTTARTFSEAASLKEVKLPSTLTHIAAYVFEKTTSLKSIELPAGLTLLGNYAFKESGIESLVLPSSLATLGTSNVFQNCKALKGIYIPSDIKLSAITASIFSGCDNLKIYTDMTEEAFRAKFSTLSAYTVIGETSVSEFQTVMAPTN